MKDKIVFIDMDGCISAYSNDSDKVICDTFEDGFFLDRKPVTQVIAKINELFLHPCILSAAPHEQAIKEKWLWLDTHFDVEERYFIIWKQDTKADFIKNYCTEHNVDLKNVILVDDDHKILEAVERLGCQVYHVSRLLTLEKGDIK